MKSALSRVASIHDSHEKEHPKKKRVYQMRERRAKNNGSRKGGAGKGSGGAGKGGGGEDTRNCIEKLYKPSN